MHKGSKYLIKVQDELSVYQRYLINEDEQLTPTEQETWRKLTTVREWLLEGWSDAVVKNVLRKTYGIKEHRCRELVVMAYGIFAELNVAKDKKGVKYMYAEMLRRAAMFALTGKIDPSEEGAEVWDDEAGGFVKKKHTPDYDAYYKLIKEAAKIDGAYDEEKQVVKEDFKKPTKLVIQKVTNNTTINYGDKKGESDETRFELVE